MMREGGESRRVLVTVFEAFGGRRWNCSLEVGRSLDGLELEGIDLRVEVLPVVRGRAAELVWELVGGWKPEVILMLGEAGNRRTISLERVARNWDAFRIPDNGGQQVEGEEIEADGPETLGSGLPLERMKAVLEREGCECEWSDSAGSFVCNHLFYRVMRGLAAMERKVEAGFVHLPYAKDDAEAAETERSGMSIAEMASGIQAVLQEIWGK